jgi:hypothetical protein
MVERGEERIAGEGATLGPPTLADLQRLLEVSHAYGWFGCAEDNAATGISLGRRCLA